MRGCFDRHAVGVLIDLAVHISSTCELTRKLGNSRTQRGRGGDIRIYRWAIFISLRREFSAKHSARDINFYVAKARRALCTADCRVFFKLRAKHFVLRKNLLIIVRKSSRAFNLTLPGNNWCVFSLFVRRESFVIEHVTTG